MEEAPNDLHMAVCAVVVGVVCGTGFALCDASMGGVCGGQDSFSSRWVSDMVRPPTETLASLIPHREYARTAKHVNLTCLV